MTTVNNNIYYYKFSWPSGPNEVYVTGTFDNWSKSLRLEKTENGFELEASLPKPKEQDKILYKYVVDNDWVLDSSAKLFTGEDGFTNNYLDSSDFYTTKTSISNSSIPPPQTDNLSKSGTTNTDTIPQESSLNDNNSVRDNSGDAITKVESQNSPLKSPETEVSAHSNNRQQPAPVTMTTSNDDNSNSKTNQDAQGSTMDPSVEKVMDAAKALPGIAIPSNPEAIDALQTKASSAKEPETKAPEPVENSGSSETKEISKQEEDKKESLEEEVKILPVSEPSTISKDTTPSNATEKTIAAISALPGIAIPAISNDDDENNTVFTSKVQDSEIESKAAELNKETVEKEEKETIEAAATTTAASDLDKDVTILPVSEPKITENTIPKNAVQETIAAISAAPGIVVPSTANITEETFPSKVSDEEIKARAIELNKDLDSSSSTVKETKDLVSKPKNSTEPSTSEAQDEEDKTLDKEVTILPVSEPKITEDTVPKNAVEETIAAASALPGIVVPETPEVNEAFTTKVSDEEIKAKAAELNKETSDLDKEVTILPVSEPKITEETVPSNPVEEKIAAISALPGIAVPETPEVNKAFTTKVSDEEIKAKAAELSKKASDLDKEVTILPVSEPKITEDTVPKNAVEEKIAAISALPGVAVPETAEANEAFTTKASDEDIKANAAELNKELSSTEKGATILPVSEPKITEETVPSNPVEEKVAAISALPGIAVSDNLEVYQVPAIKFSDEEIEAKAEELIKNKEEELNKSSEAKKKGEEDLSKLPETEKTDELDKEVTILPVSEPKVTEDTVPSNPVEEKIAAISALPGIAVPETSEVNEAFTTKASDEEIKAKAAELNKETSDLDKEVTILPVSEPKITENTIPSNPVEEKVAAISALPGIAVPETSEINEVFTTKASDEEIKAKAAVLNKEPAETKKEDKTLDKEVTILPVSEPKITEDTIPSNPVEEKIAAISALPGIAVPETPEANEAFTTKISDEEIKARSAELNEPEQISSKPVSQGTEVSTTATTTASSEVVSSEPADSANLTEISKTSTEVTDVTTPTTTTTKQEPPKIDTTIIPPVQKEDILETPTAPPLTVSEKGDISPPQLTTTEAGPEPVITKGLSLSTSALSATESGSNLVVADKSNAAETPATNATTVEEETNNTTTAATTITKNNEEQQPEPVQQHETAHYENALVKPVKSITQSLKSKLKSKHSTTLSTGGEVTTTAEESSTTSKPSSHSKRFSFRRIIKGFFGSK